MAAALFDLSGHVALVTGGNSGIGLGFADGLAAHGATVVIWGTNPQKNMAAAATLRNHGGEVVDMICDVGNEAAVIDSITRSPSSSGTSTRASSTPASPAGRRASPG